MDDQQKFERLEERIESLGRRIEEMAEKIGQKVEKSVNQAVENAEPIPSQHRHHDHEIESWSSGRIFVGIAFVLGGAIWLGNQVGWFDVDIPFGATAIILVGLYMIVSSRRR